MRITQVRAIADFANGNKLEALRGTITKVYEYKSDPDCKPHPWSLQNVKFRDQTGEIMLVFKDREPIGENWEGAVVLFEAKVDPKDAKKLSGIEVDDYNGKRRVMIRSQAIIGDGTEVDDGGGQQERQQAATPPRQQQAAPPPGRQQQQAAAPPPGRQQTQSRQQPPDLQAEERAEQEAARPQGQQGQRKEQLSPEEQVNLAKRRISANAMLYALCYDAAVLHAYSVASRHGHYISDAGIGATATTLFIEANKQGIKMPHGNPCDLPLPKYKLGDLLKEQQTQKTDTEQPQSANPDDLANAPDQSW